MYALRTVDASNVHVNDHVNREPKLRRRQQVKSGCTLGGETTVRDSVSPSLTLPSMITWDDITQKVVESVFSALLRLELYGYTSRVLVISDIRYTFFRREETWCVVHYTVVSRRISTRNRLL